MKIKELIAKIAEQDATCTAYALGKQLKSNLSDCGGSYNPEKDISLDIIQILVDCTEKSIRVENFDVKAEGGKGEVLTIETEFTKNTERKRAREESVERVAKEFVNKQFERKPTLPTKIVSSKIVSSRYIPTATIAPKPNATITSAIGGNDSQLLPKASKIKRQRNLENWDDDSAHSAHSWNNFPISLDVSFPSFTEPLPPRVFSPSSLMYEQPTVDIKEVESNAEEWEFGEDPEDNDDNDDEEDTEDETQQQKYIKQEQECFIDKTLTSLKDNLGDDADPKKELIDGVNFLHSIMNKKIEQLNVEFQKYKKANEDAKKKLEKSVECLQNCAKKMEACHLQYRTLTKECSERCEEHFLKTLEISCRKKKPSQKKPKRNKNTMI
jgi:hypothetical protein